MHESVPIRDVGICLQWELPNDTEPPCTPPSIPRPLTKKKRLTQVTSNYANWLLQIKRRVLHMKTAYLPQACFGELDVMYNALYIFYIPYSPPLPRLPPCPYREG